MIVVSKFLDDDPPPPNDVKHKNVLYLWELVEEDNEELHSSLDHDSGI